MKYIIATLGCKVNQYESEAMEQLLQSHGHTPCAEGESADAVIVNTCAVTAEGARKARQTVRRLRRENPDALTALCGCWSQVDAAEAASLGAYEAVRQTGVPVLTAGDMASGASLVVLAIASGKQAAARADASLMGYTNIL